MKAIKKSIEKIILCVLASMMVIVMTGNSAFAAGTSETETPPTLQEMRSYLLSIGTEEEFLNDIDENRIEKLYWTCVGKEVSFVGYEKEIVEIQDGDPRLRGQIATSKLQLGMAVYEFTANGGTIVTGLNVSTSYKWLSDPFLHWTDAHTFNFDGSKFKIGGIYAESGYQVEKLWLRVDSVDAPAKAVDGGIGWYLSIAKGDLSNSYTNSGGAEIYPIPRSGSETKASLSSSMYYGYAHQTALGSISFNVSGIGVSFGNGSYDYQTKIYNY